MAETLVIRGGTVVDGTGGPPYEADVALAGDRIAAIGKALPKGDREIDARGKLVTPGFVDVHTHYDAQVTWASQISPSSWNGVTSVLIGNCGVGFAPCLPERRDMLVKLMEGVEDIPEVVLTEGLPWNWQTFPEYLDALDARRFDLDVATQVPHSAVRVHVMGERGANREPATEEDRARMAAIVAEGLRAGALGFATSRTIAHKTLAGDHIPTLRAAEAELAAIGQAMRGVGAGWMQVISDFDDPEQEFGILRRVAEGFAPADDLLAAPARAAADAVARAARQGGRGEPRRVRHEGAGDGPPDRRHAGLRDLAESVRRAPSLARDQGSAVRREARQASHARVPRAPAVRAHRRPDGAAPPETPGRRFSR